MSGVDPVMFFDGRCNFCNASVQFVVDHERGPDFRFAPIDSDVATMRLGDALGKEAAAEVIKNAEGSDRPTVVVLEDGNVHLHSSAVLSIARRLRMPWRIGIIFWLVPRFVRDTLYIWFARNRYRLFGRAESCRVPTPELRSRFLA